MWIKSCCVSEVIFVVFSLIISMSWSYAQVKHAELREVSFSEAVPLKYPEHIGLVTSSSSEGKMNVMTVGWYMIAGMDPPKFAISIGKSRYTYGLITETREFVLAYPTEDMEKEILYCGTHTGREVDKFKETKLTPIEGKSVKAPLIKECKVNFECKVIGTLDSGSHTVFLGEVLHSWVNTELKEKRRIYNLGRRIFKGLP